MKLIKKIIISILIWESRIIIAKYKPFIVAVTGSVGKTSTKDAIYSVLRERGGYVRKSEKSFNSEIGVPLTIIGVPNAWRDIGGWMRNILSGFELIISKHEYPDTLILELGADHPGDIKRVASWLTPDISVITRVSRTPVHVEFFSSPEEVFEEKSALAQAVKKGGTLVLFGDDEKVASLKSIGLERGASVVTFGISESVDIKGSDIVTTYEAGLPTGFSFKINNEIAVNVKDCLGTSYVYPLLVAAAAGKARGLSSERITKGLNSFEPPHGRMNIIAGIHGSVVIDDTYNSSPDAALSALETLAGLSVSGKKIALLADMMELGQFAAEKHREIGKEAVRLIPQGILVTVGQRSRATADEAGKCGLVTDHIHVSESAIEAVEYVKPLIQTGDVVLVKGSQSMRMERAVKALMSQPERASELLVRQEKEWEVR